MPRNIVLFSDGTGNSARSLFKTNVRRLYEALDLTDPVDPAHPRQFAFYDDGVGTSEFKPLAALGGAFGIGLSRNVQDLYGFLCRTWQPGDRIYGFGFSRGAFTIRVVAGLVLHQGIVPYDGDEAAFGRNVADAYRAYRADRYGRRLNHQMWWPIQVARAARDLAVRAKRGVLRQGYCDLSKNIGRDDAADPVHVEMLGVWDTVDAYGLPIEELTRAIDAYVWPLTLPDANLHPRVRQACQALALDEERQTFLPRLWNEKRPADAARIAQVWFAGVHADVGGGYSDASLSYIPLNWMVRQAEAAGLRFNADIRIHQEALADANGPIHDPRSGLGGYYRYRPRDVRALTTRDQAAKYKPQVIVERPKIHESVFRRIQDGQDGYMPVGLPPAFDVLRKDGRLEDGDRFLGLLADGRKSLDQQQELVMNRAVLRRAAYYLTFAATAAILSMPLWNDADRCSSALCFAAPGVRLLGAVLPGLAAPWVETMAANPPTTTIFVLLLLLGLVLGSTLKTAITDTMRRAWYRHLPRWAPRPRTPPGHYEPPVRPGWLDRLLTPARASDRIERLRQWLTRTGVPVLALIVTLYLGLAMLNGAAVAMLESAGGICREDAPVETVLDIRQVCQRVHAEAVPGVTYAITLAVPRRRQPAAAAPDPASSAASPPELLPRPESWADDTIPASPNGVDYAARGGMQTFLQSIAVPLRRHLRENWLQLMIRLGAGGADSFPADWRMQPNSGSGGTGDPMEEDVYEAKFTAHGRGPIFLYVNDAMLAWPPDLFHRNNHGTARVTVREIERDRP